MHDEPRDGDGTGSATPTPPTEAGGPRSSVARWRLWLAWAGIATIAIVLVLATWHLWSDVSAMLSIPGGIRAVLARLVPSMVLVSGAIVLSVLVLWLAGTGRRGELLAIGIAVATLVVIRVLIAAAFDGQTRGEPAAYDDIARSFLAGDLDPRSRPMGYPAMLASAYAIGGRGQSSVEALNLVLATLAGGAVLAIGRGLYGARAGAMALLLYALWPAGALMVTVRMPETSYDVAIAASAWAAVVTRPGWRGSALTGALLAASQYLRPSTPALLPAFLLARLWPGGPWRGQLVRVVAPMAAMFLLVLSPVIWYDLDRSGELSISTSDFGGHSFYMGTNIESGGMYDRAADDHLIDLAGPDIAARSALGTQLAWQRIREDPVGIAALAVRKQDTLWGTEHYGVEYGIDRWLTDRLAHPRAATPFLLSQGFYVVVLLAALVGLIVRRRDPDALMALLILMVWSVSAVHAVLEVRDRHHSYVIPLLLPVAAFGLASVLARVRRRST